MAKRRQQSGRRSAPQKSRRKRSAAASPLIPIVVGVVVVAVVAALLLSLDSWRSSPAGGPAGSAANSTALPLATQQIPYPDVPRIAVEEARDRLARGEIVMVDVRGQDSYDALHIEGAISLPEAEIEDRLGELDPGSRLVLYCT